MLHLYSDKIAIPEGCEYILDNLEFFKRVTYHMLDEKVNGVLNQTDGAVYLNSTQFMDKFGNTVPWINLSTGGMTVLNVLYHSDKFCFDTLECGRNALTDLKNLKEGRVYPNYICNLDNVDEIEVIVDDNEDLHFKSYRRWVDG